MWVVVERHAATWLTPLCKANRAASFFGATATEHVWCLRAGCCPRKKDSCPLNPSSPPTQDPSHQSLPGHTSVARKQAPLPGCRSSRELGTDFQGSILTSSRKPSLMVVYS